MGSGNRPAAPGGRRARNVVKVTYAAMAIDSVRLLSDSAAQLWRRLSLVQPLETPDDTPGFDAWIAGGHRPLDQAEEQALRRDYRRLLTLIEELEVLVRSRSRAVELVREQAAQAEPARPARAEAR